MKKQRKKRTSHPASGQAGGPPADLHVLARRELEAGRFREAITAYKDLLKQGDPGEARAGLAAAYAGRAGQLAAKGMLKEALVIWENRRQLGDAATPSAAHAVLLLRLGRTADAAAVYRDARRGEDAGTLAAIGQALAAHVLAGDEGIARVLPADDPVVVQRAAAREALAAYCRGDDAALAERLAAIPFRSPYRDAAQILKALQRLPERPQEAVPLLARVADDSAFAPLRRAAELALVPQPELPAALAGAGEPAVRFALTLRGWGPERQTLWMETTRQGFPPTPQTLLRLLHRARERLGGEWARGRALRLLVAEFPRSLAWLAESGARRITPAEADLVAAWRAEQRGDVGDIENAWFDYAHQLTQAGAPAPGSDAALRLALVQRRVDRTKDILAGAAEAGEADELAQAVAGQLEESLVHDPDDAETCLRLITYYRGVHALKDARRQVDAALERWPKDVRVLTAALDTALAGDAFKKAAGLARRILDIDPINTVARERLVDAHLSHARKRLRAGRADLARRELSQAGEWAVNGVLAERVDLAGAFVTLAETPAAGHAALAEQVGRLGGGVIAGFVLAVEAAGLGRPPVPLLEDLKLARARVRGREDLLDLLARLRAHLDRGGRLPREVALWLDKPLKAAAAQMLSQQETESACETLRRAKLDGPRRAFAEPALKRWPGAPRFELHLFEARWGACPWQASEAALRRLDRAGRRARAEGDLRTAHRIDEVLDAAAGPFRGLPPALTENSPGDLVVGLIESIGLDAVLDMLEIPPEVRRAMRESERELGRDAFIDLLRQLDAGKLPGLPPLSDGPSGDQPRPGKGARPRPKGGGSKRRSPGDDDHSGQLDLFS